LLRSWPAALLLVAMTAGCGGSSVPEGRPIAVRFDVVERPGPSAVPGVRIAQPLTVHEIDTEWDRVSRLLPEDLPKPVDQGSDCWSGHLVSVRVANKDGFAGEVSYGPCRWPEEINPVRLLMHTLLRRKLAAERRCDCP
jgi:hypothetical protein